MIDYKIDRKFFLQGLVEKILRDYHTDLFKEEDSGWMYRDRIKISMFEAVIYCDAEDDGLRDITRDEMLWVKSEVIKKSGI